MLVSSSRELHCALGSTADCGTAGMRISTSSQSEEERWSPVGQFSSAGEFKCLFVLFTSQGKMECEIERWIGSVSAVMRSFY